jgi:hypothetical protein
MERRVIVAFAVAPAVVPLAMVAWALSTGVRAPESIVLGSIYAAFTYGAAVLLGAPSFALFQRRGWTRWWQYTIAGAAIGLAVLLVMSAAVQQRSTNAQIALIFVGVGVLSTMVFWLIAVWRRADVSVPRASAT